VNDAVGAGSHRHDILIDLDAEAQELLPELPGKDVMTVDLARESIPPDGVEGGGSSADHGISSAKLRHHPENAANAGLRDLYVIWLLVCSQALQSQRIGKARRVVAYVSIEVGVSSSKTDRILADKPLEAGVVVPRPRVTPLRVWPEDRRRP
jgi:hypothetical protein